MPGDTAERWFDPYPCSLCGVRPRWGVAHHSSYLPWMEMGRTELLRAVGESYAALEAAGVFLVVTKLEVKYRRPIRYDDVIELWTSVAGATKVKLMHSYELVLVERGGKVPDHAVDASVPLDGVCAVGSTEIACVGGDGRPRGVAGVVGGVRREELTTEHAEGKVRRGEA
ncbi:MAG: hotdog domain-containing protein [Phycisphaerales bacterium]